MPFIYVFFSRPGNEKRPRIRTGFPRDADYSNSPDVKNKIKIKDGRCGVEWCEGFVVRSSIFQLRDKCDSDSFERDLKWSEK